MRHVLLSLNSFLLCGPWNWAYQGAERIPMDNWSPVPIFQLCLFWAHSSHTHSFQVSLDDLCGRRFGRTPAPVNLFYLNLLLVWLIDWCFWTIAFWVFILLSAVFFFCFLFYWLRVFFRMWFCWFRCCCWRNGCHANLDWVWMNLILMPFTFWWC